MLVEAKEMLFGCRWASGAVFAEVCWCVKKKKVSRIIQLAKVHGPFSDKPQDSVYETLSDARMTMATTMTHSTEVTNRSQNLALWT